MQTQPYKEIRDSLRTGDIVLYAGKSGFSQWIKQFTGSRWSHVGMVFRMPQFEFITVWESTTGSKAKDVISGKHRDGVQMFQLSQRLANYDGEIAIRRLHGVDLTERLTALETLRKELKGKPYETSQFELLAAVIDKVDIYTEEDLSSVFCSELVAEAYQRLGLLSEDKPSNEYVPAEFSSEREITLLQGAALSEEILVLPQD